MIEVEHDLWDLDVDVRCVTTNGSVLNGKNPMGGGCAREARERYFSVERQLGAMIQAHGNHVYLLAPDLVAFPTKVVISAPASLGLIERSVRELVTLTDLYGWNKVALPRPGCGLGGLRWRDVRPALVHLDDRFLIVDYPRIAA